MHLYLLRHAHALAGADDAARPLSKRGRKQIRTLGRWLRANRALDEVAECWHSPLVRSRDTAALLVRRLHRPVRTVVTAGLTPADEPAPLLRRLRTRQRPLLIVGHEPHLSALASLLVAGEPEPPVFTLRKCALLALIREQGRWLVRWQIGPELLA
jgi:phosphohistidine phosphatase